jgi:heme oxygenase
MDLNHLLGQYKNLLSRDGDSLAEFAKINQDLVDVRSEIEKTDQKAISAYKLMTNSGAALGSLSAEFEITKRATADFLEECKELIKDKLDRSEFLDYLPRIKKQIRMTENTLENSNLETKLKLQNSVKTLNQEIQL